MEPRLQIEANFYPQHRSLFDELLRTVSWDESMQARKTASFGQPHDYSQMSYPAALVLPRLIEVRDRLQDALHVPVNNCLANYYETGENRMGFHTDDTAVLLPGTGVAIVSLGSPRTITYRSLDQ